MGSEMEKANQRFYRIAYCNCCKTSRLLRYDGPQYLDRKLLYQQYSCVDCGATKVFDHTEHFLEIKMRLQRRKEPTKV